MNKSLHVLLVDDHPIVIDAYKNSLEQFSTSNNEFNIIIDAAKCCDSAIKQFKASLKDQPYDVVFLDVRLPSTNSKLTSGLELAIVFKNLQPAIKLIIITGHYDAFVFNNILQNINPDGLLYKSDASMSTIEKVMKNILNDIPYYSSSVLQLLRKNVSSKIVLSDIDKLLLQELSKGTKTKDLKKMLPLSQGGVEKRKRFLKDLFNAQNLNDEALVKIAKEKGFL